MYILEGNIGAGKSTFLKLIEEHQVGISVVQEPKENWCTPTEGVSLFERFYHEPTRWAYTIETLIMTCRVRDHLQAQVDTNPNRLMERSVYSGHYCFAKNGFESGYFTSLEWYAYSKLLDFMVQEQCRLPLGFIYLQTTPEICFQRIKTRNRDGERDISIEYLTRIHNLHEKFLVQHDEVFEELKKVPVLMLDGNDNFLKDKNYFETLIGKVREFMQVTQQVNPSIRLTELGSQDKPSTNFSELNLS
jgi:deoxyadenosine/deoxycytidine kinase